MSPANPAAAKLEKKSDVQLIWVLSLFVALTAAMIASPVARLAVYLFPALTFAVALYTYVRSKPVYAGLVCWLWILTPFIRRLVDWRAGWIPATLVQTAPVLACYAAIPFMLFDWKRLFDRAAPVLAGVAAIFYGVGIAVLNHNHLSEVVGNLVFWISPLCFGLFVCHNRDDASGIYRAVASTFIWALPVMGIYGLVQYFYLPAWDRLWIENSNLVSIGSAAPQSFRLFGSLNSPQALGSFLLIGLLFTFHSVTKLKYLSVPAALLALTLTGARSAWLGFSVGLIYLFFHIPTRQRLQITASAVLAFILLLVAFQSDAKQSVFNRFQSLTDPTDNSLNTRYRGYQALLPKFLDEPYGGGIGFDQGELSQGTEGLATGDSAVIALLLSLGLIGTVVYISGFSLLLVGPRGRASSERTVLKACVFAIVSEALLTNIVEGQSGFLLWSTAALCFQSRFLHLSSYRAPDVSRTLKRRSGRPKVTVATTGRALN